MKSARKTLPPEPVHGLTGGIDWARDNHALSIVDTTGREIARHMITHNAPGLRNLVTVLTKAGVSEVAIERPDGPVVDTLMGCRATRALIH